ncbi:MAG: hypothetical protein IPM27_06755 [Nitrosomonadales bacterium]|nr:hypothetical protein [Nitrosomonadales bacterium]
MAARKLKGAPKEDSPLNKSVPVIKGATENETNRNFARLATSPELAAYRAINGVENKSGIGEHIDVPTLLDELRGQAAAVNRGELNHVEAMLMNQATALQSLFSRLAERGMGCEHAPAFEANMRIALRAQSQCRATLETLAAIKNPPVVFAKQANINHGSGNQQVNNGTPAPDNRSSTRTGAHAERNLIQPNELLEVQHGGKTLDSRTTGRAGGKNQAMAAVG